MAEQTNVEIEQSDFYKKKKSKEEMQKQLISFGMMILFTVVAFGLVASESIGRTYVIPILFVMAIIQAGFQFYYFMHLKDKGHQMPATLILGGVWCAFLTLAGLVVISWW